MTLVRADVDPGNVLAREFTVLERKNLPFAAVQAANATAFAVRQRWAEIMPRIFDRPTPMTQKAAVYLKATLQRPIADVLIRDEAHKGTPPAKYLQAQVTGGGRALKGVEKRLQARGLMPAGQYVVPGRGAQLDAYGNIPGSQINKVLSQLGARFDALQNETDKSAQRRRRREVKKEQRGGDYFAVTKQRGRLAPGVYQRIRSNFGSAVRSVLRYVQSVSYRPRYPIFDLAKKLYDRQFPFHFDRELAKAVQTSKFRGRG